MAAILNQLVGVPSEQARISVTLTFLCDFRRWSRTAGFRAAVLTFTSSEKCSYWDARGLQEQSFRHQVGLPGEPCKQHLQAFSMVDTMNVHRARENALNVCDLSRHIRVISDRNKIVIDHLGPVGIRTSRFLKRESPAKTEKVSGEHTAVGCIKRLPPSSCIKY